MALKVYDELIQGSEEWFAARCGMLTASEMKHILTPTLKVASNEKERTHVSELAVQRITGYVEPSFVSDDMLRGTFDEVRAKIIYGEEYGEVQDVGFIVEDKFGFPIGYSPDGFVGEDGLIECKSRRQKYQLETIISDTIPEEHVLQVQTGLLVSGRKWCDYVSYCGGMFMKVIRVYPDHTVQEAIIRAATAFEKSVTEKIEKYNHVINNTSARITMTERVIEEEMI